VRRRYHPRLDSILGQESSASLIAAWEQRAQSSAKLSINRMVLEMVEVHQSPGRRLEGDIVGDVEEW
jgi:hypothetical protein